MLALWNALVLIVLAARIGDRLYCIGARIAQRVRQP